MDIESYIYGYRKLHLWIENAISIDRNTVNSR